MIPKAYRYVDSYKYKDMYFDLIKKIIQLNSFRKDSGIWYIIHTEQKKLDKMIRTKENQLRL